MYIYVYIYISFFFSRSSRFQSIKIVLPRNSSFPLIVFLSIFFYHFLLFTSFSFFFGGERCPRRRLNYRSRLPCAISSLERYSVRRASSRFEKKIIKLFLIDFFLSFFHFIFPRISFFFDVTKLYANFFRTESTFLSPNI